MLLANRTLRARAKARRVLEGLGFHDRVRFTPLWELYCRIFRRSFVRDRAAELRFYRDLLALSPSEAGVFDVGANKGWKSDTFERLGREVIAIEPDATNAVYMRRRFLKKPVRVLQMAVSKQNGKATFFVEESGSAFNTLSEKWVRTLEDKEATRFSTVCDFNASVVVELVTLDELIERYGRPAYIKIDIEGAEVDAIRGLSVPVPLLSFELNLPEFSEEGLQSLELLHDLAGDVVFNWSASCEQGFEMDHWQPYLRFRDFLENTSVRYMEVYASMPV